MTDKLINNEMSVAQPSSVADCYDSSRPKGKLIFIREEDILNLKCAEKRIMETITPDYDALEIFTIRNIIEAYEEA